MSNLIYKILKIDPTKLNAYSTGLLQGKAYSRLNTRLSSALSPFNISIPDWKLLGQLYDHKQLKLSDLATILSYDPPMVTKLVKSLEKKKLLTRKESRTDERAKIVDITDQGAKLILTIEPVVKREMKDILEGVSLPSLITYLKVLETIIRNTDR